MEPETSAAAASFAAATVDKGMLARVPSLLARSNSLFEQQLAAQELPIPGLQRLESVQDINEQLLREASDFADFRVEDIHGAASPSSSSSSSSSTAKSGGWTGPASLIRQSSLDAINRDERRIGGTSVDDIVGFLEMQPALHLGQGQSENHNAGASEDASFSADGARAMATGRESSFERGDSFPIAHEDGTVGSSVDGVFARGNSLGDGPIDFNSNLLSNSFVPSLLRRQSSGASFPGTVADPGADENGSGSTKANSAKTSMEPIMFPGKNPLAKAVLRVADSAGSDDSDSDASSDSDDDDDKGVPPVPVKSMTAEEFDEKVRQLNAERARGENDDIQKTTAFAHRKAKCDVFDTVEKLVCNVMCEHPRLRGGSDKMRKRAEKLESNPEDREKFYRYLKRLAKPGEESDDESTSCPPYRTHDVAKVKENKWYKVCACTNYPRCFQIKLSGAKSAAAKKKKANKDKPVEKHPAECFTARMTKRRKVALRGLVTYCMFRGGFEDRTHGVARHNQKPTTAQVNMWKEALVEFGLPVAKYLEWVGEGKEKYWPRFLLECMAGKSPPDTDCKRQGLAAMRMFFNDFFSATPNGDPAAHLANYYGKSAANSSVRAGAAASPTSAVAAGSSSSSSSSSSSLTTSSSSAYAPPRAAQAGWERPAEPHQSSEDYYRVSMAFLNKNFRTLQKFAPHLDPSGGEATTYDELLHCVNGGSGVNYFENIEAMNDAESLPRLFIKIYFYVQRGNLYRLFSDLGKGLADLTKARLILTQGCRSNVLTDIHHQNLEARINMVLANIIRKRDGWGSTELEDLFQALEFTAVRDAGLRRYARFQRVTRLLHLAYAQRRTGHLLGASSSSAAAGSSPAPSLSHGETVALRDLDFLEREYVKALEDWRCEYGEDDEKTLQLWMQLQHIKFDKVKWMAKLGVLTDAQALDEYKIMLVEQRKKLGDSNRNTINLMRKVARMLIAPAEKAGATGSKRIQGSVGAVSAENMSEAKRYIDIARQHALDKEWARRKLAPVIELYEAAKKPEEGGPPKKKSKV